ncbi:sensor histidine kinase [Klenkia taihuensis]|uniref:histidine kinase n=1 Tax=Klenkia taihuensis TaxID=1225127 RepID=A0A1I1QBZ5_9ACTN|nr:HAMP domain-containing sensor histidine kinase [Klenkia taihuensis]SFD19482.1 Signal transduction histidine kinase [Klenkia taihuensis]
MVAPWDDRHQLLVLAASLAFLAAGAAHLMRGRLTGSGSSRQLGAALVILGLHLPASFVVRVLLDGDAAVLARATEAAMVAAAAVCALRALVPRAPAVLRRGLVAAVTGIAVLLLGLLGSSDPGTVRGALAAGFLGAALLWAAVAVVADRADPLGDSGRASSQAVALVAAALAIGTACTGVSAVVPPGPLVGGLVDLLLLGAGVLAAAAALRRIGDALDGQERYVAGLVEQLAQHELVLQQTRGCLHDARAALAGIQAATSASHHPAVRSDPRRRQQLERATADEMRRLQRMLRMPERPAAVAEVDLDVLLSSLVTVHRERGLRVRWDGGTGTPVRTDGDAVAVIVGNLLGNALVHAPGALVEVRVRVAEVLTIQVSDDGPGLTDLQRLGAFEAGARRDGSPGEGIGLALSRDLARRHGGDLVSRPATAGATFRLTLPVHPLPVPVEPLPGTGVVDGRTGLRLAG